ncbi:hypothetical protein [Streptomyces viridosporus]|uniref:hypothetical protein n=1 Tax=Streptomyces viridosporus TaxID=67581 RepID=UPI0036FB5D85
MDFLQEDERPSSESCFRLSSPRPITADETRTAPAVTDTPGNSQQEIIEDEQPAEDRQVIRVAPQISEDETPQNAETAAFVGPHKIDETRHKLAMGMLWLVGLVAVLPTLALMASRWTNFTAEAYREVALVFTPVVALTSAAFGFFFASDDRNNRL